MKVRKKGFTLAEVLITLAVIGIIVAITVPVLQNYFFERAMVTGVKQFYSILSQAVGDWKNDIGCNSDAYTCIMQSDYTDQTLCLSYFNNGIGKFLKTNDIANWGASNLNYATPAYTNCYDGSLCNGSYGGVSQRGGGLCKVALKNGMTASFSYKTTYISVFVDINGNKAPNRIGKDTFPFTIGGKAGKDIYPYIGNSSISACSLGLCGYWTTCDPNNTNPTVGNGASPTAYVLTNDKLPDFQQLSQTVTGFAP